METVILLSEQLSVTVFREENSFTSHFMSDHIPFADLMKYHYLLSLFDYSVYLCYLCVFRNIFLPFFSDSLCLTGILSCFCKAVSSVSRALFRMVLQTFSSTRQSFFPAPVLT